MKLKSALIFHVYIKGNWKTVTAKLLETIPHDDIYINVNIDLKDTWKIVCIWNWFRRYQKLSGLVFTSNLSSKSEVAGFEKLRSLIKDKGYEIVTYMHAKGVTKPLNKNIEDWVELMRYYIIDRMDLCLDAFLKGYKLYGVNMEDHSGHANQGGPYKNSTFHFSGNFVTVNLKLLNKDFFSTSVDNDYFGVESFWAKLCKSSEAYSAHLSNIDHYQNPYPEVFYKV